MANFMIRFLFSNIYICAAIGILLTARQVFQNHLTSRMQYNLWYLLLGLLAVPFLPIRSISFPRIFLWMEGYKKLHTLQTETIAKPAAAFSQPGTAWMNDFSVSVSQGIPSYIGLTLCAVWIFGVLSMTVIMARSMIRFNILRKSALPLQSRAVHDLYQNCLAEMNITGTIPVYSTAFLKSPVIAGLFRPSIYLPIHLISDYDAASIRYMLLHELQHYRHKDALANYLMNLAIIIYWFNPLVWYALKEMRNDREVACDTSVLKKLDENSYETYGSILIDFAEKVSLTPFPFASGISGNMKQMQKRILNIANYRPATFRKNLRSTLSYTVIAAFLLGFVPVLSTQAADQDHYCFHTNDKDISYIDLSTCFNGYSGSFVLYDETADSWLIYNLDAAATRIPPASTYKIYIALSGLQSGIITPEQSLLSWDGQANIYDTWNADQTLDSAMQNSVTWYFQAIDRQLGLSSIKEFIRETGYGNQTVRGDESTYWLNSSLKISPLEQIELLQKLCDNEFQFDEQNIEAVKDSICLSSTSEGSLYGKTGTGEADHQNVSGWFIGFIEKDGHTSFFATNIQGESNVTGPAAAELTFTILSDLNFWHQKL